MIKPASKKDIEAVQNRVPITFASYQARAFIRLMAADGLKLDAMTNSEVEYITRRVAVYCEGIK